MDTFLSKNLNYFPYSFILSGHTADQQLLMGKYCIQYELKNEYPIFKHQYHDYFCKREGTYLIFVYNRNSLQENTGAIRICLLNNEIYGEYFGYNNFWNYDNNLSLEIAYDMFSICENRSPKTIILFGNSICHKKLIGEYRILPHQVNKSSIFKNIYYDFYIYKSSLDNNWLITYNYEDIQGNIAGIKTSLPNDNLLYIYTYDNTWIKNENLGLLFKYQ